MRMQDALEKVLSLSKADGCVAIGRETYGSNVRWANNSATTNGETKTQSLTVVSVVGKRVGTVTRSVVADEDLAGVVAESEAAAAKRPEAEDYMPLVEPPSGAIGAAAEESSWDADPEPVGIEVFAEFAPTLGDVLERGEIGGVKLFGYADHSATNLYLASSTGLRRRYAGRIGSAQINAKSPDFALSSWGGRITKTFADVDAHGLYDDLNERLQWSKNQISMEPGHYEVILQPSATADMVVWAHRMATLRDADEGRSAFSKPEGGNRVGEQLYPESISIYSDPSEPGFEVAPFVTAAASTAGTSVFDNGLALDRTDWVDHGRLQALVSTRHWAQRSGVNPTPGIDNLMFVGGDATLDEMIEQTARGLLITSFWYIRMLDPQTMVVTGLTRDGVFLIEDGEVRGAVNNFRFNMSPVKMLAQTTQLGVAEPAAGRGGGRFLKMPPIRVDNFYLSTVSQAT